MTASSTAARAFPGREELTICFAHVAYALAERFPLRDTGFNHFQVWSREELAERLPEAHVLLVSGFWRDELLDNAPNLRFIQSIGAGYDQFDQAKLRARGIRLASAQGVNRNAVSEHAISMILGLARQLHTGRDNQHKRFWRGMIGDVAKREDELGGKTLVIVGMGGIGSRLAALAKAFDMHVVGVRRNPDRAQGPADMVQTPDTLPELLPQADYVALTCPLTPETRNIINARSFELMKSTAYLVNVARGGCVEEAALIKALEQGQIAGAALDAFQDEPLAQDSPLWGMENVIITPHTAGETQRYEENLFDILLENLDRLMRGEEPLLNQVI